MITLSENQLFIDKKLDIEFEGSFGIITLNTTGKLLKMYIGENMLRFGKTVLTPERKGKSANMDYGK